jgi:hypothetical protein
LRESAYAVAALAADAVLAAATGVARRPGLRRLRAELIDALLRAAVVVLDAVGKGRVAGPADPELLPQIVTQLETTTSDSWSTLAKSN